MLRQFTRKPVASTLAVLLVCAAAVPSAAQDRRAGSNQLAAGSALTAPTTPEAIEAAKANSQAPGLRLPFPPLDKMEPAMRDEFIRGGRGFYTPVGPRAALLFTPKVAAAMNTMLPALQTSEMKSDLFELTILMVAREWDSQFEWWVHEPQGIKAGLPAAAVNAIRVDRTPKFADPKQAAAYQYLKELLRDRKVSDATYARLTNLIGTQQLVEMNVLTGYYITVAINLVAHNVPLRADVKPPLPPRRK